MQIGLWSMVGDLSDGYRTSHFHTIQYVIRFGFVSNSLETSMLKLFMLLWTEYDIEHFDHINLTENHQTNANKCIFSTNSINAKLFDCNLKASDKRLAGAVASFIYHNF